MASTRREPLLSCSPWALLVLILFAAAYAGWRFAKPLLAPLHDPGATPRAVTARGDLAADEAATIELFKHASPSVVHIRTTERLYDPFRLRALDVPQGTGSGFLWDDRGYVVTNFHVIQEADRAFVFLENQAEPIEARYVGGDPDVDIAVLKIDPSSMKLRPITIGTSKDLQVGQKVFAIGNPFGLDHTLTTGVISALNREIRSITDRPIRGVIQTDAPINPGNSGGPLLDSAGRMIGMNTAIYVPKGSTAAEGFSVGIGFAVPIDTINRRVPELVRKGRFTPPRMGVRLAPGQVAAAMGVEGVVIESVDAGSGADRAGLRSMEVVGRGSVRADVITAIDGEQVGDGEDLLRILSERRPGDRVRLEILRDGQKLEIEVALSD